MRHPVLFAPLILATAFLPGCSPTEEPTRFIPAPAGESAATAPATTATPTAPARSAPPRNIEMH